jgi:hypothetical protein
MNKAILDDLGKNTEVTGVSSGTKIRNGVNTGEPCIVVYVPKKKPLSELKPNEIIPKRIDGKLVDIQEAVFRALALMQTPVRPKVVWEDEGSRTAKYRPAVGGISVGHPAITAGTLGTGAYLPNGNRVILSNNHVLANCNDAEIGDDIYQPGAYDGGTVTDKVGELFDFVPVIPEGGGETNEVDAAIALPTSQSDLDMLIADLTDFVQTAKPATVGMNVTKSGRTTGVTTSVVSAIDGAIRVQYPSWIAAFVNQIIVSSGFIAGGDSGSACLEIPAFGDPTDIVGLVFAGSDTMGIVCPIAPIVTAFDLAFTYPVDLQGVVKRNGVTVSGAKVMVFNLTPAGNETNFIGYIESDSNGAFSFPNALFHTETAVVFVQHTVGSTEYSGCKRIHCYQDTNYAVVNISEYTPVPDGLFCRFKLNNGDFLNGNMTVEQYLSNLF